MNADIQNVKLVIDCPCGFPHEIELSTEQIQSGDIETILITDGCVEDSTGGWFCNSDCWSNSLTMPESETLSPQERNPGLVGRP